MHTQHSSDLKPALTGLFVGIVALFIVAFSIVLLVNARFEGKAESGQVSH